MAVKRKQKPTKLVVAGEVSASPVTSEESKQQITTEGKEIEQNVPHIKIQEKYLLSKYNFRYNIVLGRVEFKTLNNSEYKVMKEVDHHSIIREMRSNNIFISNQDLKMILYSDFSEIFNPFKNYFRNLPKYDGVSDYIQDLSKTIETTNNVLWEYCFKKWLIAMTASVLVDNIVNQTVIILSGGQGIGKSTWVDNLLPKQLITYLYNGSINPNNKDTMSLLSECMLINMDELESLSKGEIGAMKEMITKSKIKVRKAYAHNMEDNVRRASFIGSVNGKDFLSDTTGNRRFLCFEIINIKNNHNINIDNVFSQALHEYKNNFQYWFDKDEQDVINSNNEQFLSTTVEEDILLSHFEPIGKDVNGNFMMTTDIAIYLASVSPFILNHSSKRNLGMALSKNKFERIKKQGRYGYFVKHKLPTLLPNLKAFKEQVN